MSFTHLRGFESLPFPVMTEPAQSFTHLRGFESC